MKAKITFGIGVAVTALSVVQFCLAPSATRVTGILVGLFFVIWGWKIGWTRHRRLTTLVGHCAVVAGCLVAAYGAYQIPFLAGPPSLIGTLDLPLFWGIFTLFGGVCMIQHGHCACCISAHDIANKKP